MDTIIKDIRFAIRTLLKRPGFIAIVILVLGLGIGSTTAIFSIVDTLILRPLPYPQSERLVMLREVNKVGNLVGVAELNFQDLQAQAKSFESIGIGAGSFQLAVSGGADANLSRISYASADLFKTMGVQPAMGRTFVPEEEVYGGPIAVVVSYSYWQNQLGSRADFDQVRLSVDGANSNVVGVMPAGFNYPAGTEIWTSRNAEPFTSRKAPMWPVIGRLRSGVTLEQARAEVSLIAQQLRQTHGDKMDAVDFTAVPLQGFLTRNVRQGLWLLLGSVGLLLLIACANFSNLLLSQLLTRQREFTVRCALGASRWRITRQVLTENLLLTLPAAAFGVLFAHFAVRLLLTMDTGTIPRLNTIAVDGRVLLFACGLAFLIAVVLSFLPGIRMAASNLTTALKSAGRGHLSGAGGRLRSVLVIGQISLTIVLLAGAGLLMRSFLNVMRVEPGFETESAVAMTLNLPTTISVEEDEQTRQFYVQLLDRIEQMPGVTAVGGTNVLPLTGTGATGTFLINNDPNQQGQGVYRIASRGYFSAMRIPLLQGRFFETGDKVDTQHVAVVSRSLVQRYWPNESPIGKRIHFSVDPEKRPLEIVGVVADIRESLEAEVKPTVYAYSFQRPQWWQVARLAIVVRAQSDPKTLVPGLRETVNSLRKNTPMSFATLDQVFASSLDTRRFTLVMFGAFGGMALLITVIGLYGMLAYSVAERTREMGIRMALGAQRRDVLQLVIKQGLKLVLVGIFVGLAGAWGLTRLMRTLLFGVTPTDSLTLGSVALTLILVALLACFIPARRATRVDPLVALREE